MDSGRKDAGRGRGADSLRPPVARGHSPAVQGEKSSMRRAAFFAIEQTDASMRKRR